jgi:hypothetical protein
VLTYITGASSTANNTTYSFGTISIGTASADRLVVVVAGGHTGSGSFSVSSCSIGGTAATRVVTSSGAAASSAIFQLGVASGTSASISVTWSGGQGRALIFVYRITGLISQTATGNNNTSGTNSTSLSTTLATSGAGVVIAGLMTGGVYSPTWGGVVQDSTLGPENSTGAGASKTGVAANASYAVSANDGSGNNDQMALAVASWR